MSKSEKNSGVEITRPAKKRVLAKAEYKELLANNYDKALRVFSEFCEKTEAELLKKIKSGKTPAREKIIAQALIEDMKSCGGNAANFLNILKILTPSSIRIDEDLKQNGKQVAHLIGIAQRQKLLNEMKRNSITQEDLNRLYESQFQKDEKIGK